MSKNLIARISVAAVAIPAILWVCYQGGAWLFGMVSLFALIGLCEYLWNDGYKPNGPFFWLALMAVGAIFGLLLEFVVPTESAVSTGFAIWVISVPVILVIFFLISTMAFAVGKLSPDELFRRSTRLMWGVIYIGLLYPCVYLVGDAIPRPYADCPSGGDYLLFLFALLWVGDTAAMGIGGWLGKHKLAPAVSPNKTIEGLLGGLVGATVIGVIMMYWKLDSFPWYHVLAISIGCSVFGQLGDLVESMWKRSIGIKDSSALIPGHGGVLDRFDSLLFAAPFMYAYVTLYFMMR